MFHSFTLSGTVSFVDIRNGTPTSKSSSMGSGLITVLAEKFVRFPAKLCRILPSLLLILSVSVFNGCPLLCLAGGSWAMLLSKKVVTWYWSRSHKSSTMISGAPALIFSNSLWLILTMSPSLCVRSSSLRSPLSRVMLGLMVTGGMDSTVITIHSGLTWGTFSPNISQSWSGIFSILALTSIGLSLLSSSKNVVGFSSVIFFCFALQWGHLFIVLSPEIISLTFCLLSSMPLSFSTWSRTSLNLLILLSGISILPHSLQAHFSKVTMMFMNLTWIMGLASSI